MISARPSGASTVFSAASRGPTPATSLCAGSTIEISGAKAAMTGPFIPEDSPLCGRRRRSATVAGGRLRQNARLFKPNNTADWIALHVQGKRKVGRLNLYGQGGPVSPKRHGAGRQESRTHAGGVCHQSSSG